MLSGNREYASDGGSLRPDGVIAMSSTTSASLLERLHDGADPLAWDDFFARYWATIYAFARQRGCSHHTAEEVVQDVMLSVFEHRDVFRYDPSHGRFRDWLGTLARNRIVTCRRRASERVRAAGGDAGADLPEPAATEAGPDAAWEAVFEQFLLMAMLDVVRREMKPAVYLAFELLALRDLPCAIVARATGLSRHAVYRSRKRVLKRLRQLAGTYRDDGQLEQCVRQALRSLPDAALQRSLTTRIEKTMGSR